MESKNTYYYKYINYKNKYNSLKNYQTVIDTYKQLTEKLYEIGYLESILNLLGWDEKTIMPIDGITARGKQTAILAQIIHKKSTSDELGNLIHCLNNPEYLSLLPTDFERGNVKEAEYNFKLNKPMTLQLINDIEQLQSRGYIEWVEARKNKSFTIFEKVFDELVQMQRKKSQIVFPNLSLYDGSLVNYEKGFDSLAIDKMFNEIKPKIINLLGQITKSEIYKNYMVPEELKGSSLWAINKQKELVDIVAKQLGFNFNRGRIDSSIHPFTSSLHPNDVRITTRYSTDNWSGGISALMHEFGHGLYEQQLPIKYEFLPVCNAVSYGAHESQSLFWERHIFSSLGFWKWLTPHIHQLFPHTLGIKPNDFYLYINKVEPGFIRVDADEVYYPLHVILRFEIEKDLINGVIDSSSIPKLWNDKIKEYMNLDVPDDLVGCLQDVHWSQMDFGYFPSYLLGTIMASQLWEKINEDIPNLEDEMANGNFKLICQWLGNKIHQHGKVYDTIDSILEFSIGEKLNPNIFIKYLTNKFNKLFNII